MFIIGQQAGFVIDSGLFVVIVNRIKSRPLYSLYKERITIGKTARWVMTLKATGHLTFILRETSHAEY